MSGKAAAPKFDLAGRIALVTGASSGLGKRFATILAASGAAVILAARRTDRLDETCAAIAATGGRAIAVAMDVADETSTIAAYDAAEAAFGPVDTIIANAGMNSEGSVLDLPIAEFDRVMAVNLRGVFLTVREGARRLIADGSRGHQRGRIVITASITAETTSPGLAVYSASKAGVVQFGKVLARDWVRHGINVNMICPGYVRTEINGDWFDTEGGARQIAKFPRRRLMEQNELDTMLLYLASDASAGVTGSSFTIDDGQSL
jgi:NAD(P)-dependent dehydrogenase (short-subunit alcohol dehydrogenase family)